MCVCVCVTLTVFKLGSQIDLSAFSAPFGIFDVSQRTCSQNQCLVPRPLLVPLGVSRRICYHCHYQHGFPRLAWICVPPSCQIRLLFRCLDSEPNTAVNTYKRNPSTKKCSRGQLRNNGCLLCSRERLCLLPIKNGLYRIRALTWKRTTHDKYIPRDRTPTRNSHAERRTSSAFESDRIDTRVHM